MIAKSGALVPLTRLARSKDMRVQRNATGALLNMTHSGTPLFLLRRLIVSHLPLLFVVPFVPFPRSSYYTCGARARRESPTTCERGRYSGACRSAQLA